MRFAGRKSARLPRLHFSCAMHLLYLDGSGSAANPNEERLVLGGVSVYESPSRWVTQELDRLAANVGGQPADSSAPLLH